MKKLYRSRVDWWPLAAIFAFAVTVVIVATISLQWWVAVIYGVMLLAAMVAMLFGLWYVIDGGVLVVYMFFRPKRFPISKIKSVRFCKGYLSSAALSFTRVQIRFVDRSVLKSSMPLEISPVDRERFVDDLLKINPDIEILNK